MILDLQCSRTKREREAEDDMASRIKVAEDDFSSSANEYGWQYFSL